MIQQKTCVTEKVSNYKKCKINDKKCVLTFEMMQIAGKYALHIPEMWTHTGHILLLIYKQNGEVVA